MQKKLIAVAIAAAISAPAFADNANVTFYGKAFLDLERVSNDKATPENATRVQTNASRFGVKGSEDLGDGLTGFYQFEVQVDADGSSGNGFGNGSRNSGVGVKGDYGQVMLGIWDTPYKLSHNAIELFDNTTVFSAINLMGRADGNTENFNTRQKNLLTYTSPNMSGLQASIAYSPDEAPTATTNKTLLSLSATYEQDAIFAAAAYDSRADATTAGTTDSALRLVGKYKMDDFWVGATVESIKVNTSATASYSQNNLELAGQYKMGPGTIAASFAKAGQAAAAGTGAKQFTLRYGYNFSKRTEAFAAYTSLKNDAAGVYGFNAGSAFGSQAGSSQSAIGAGLIHAF